MIKFLPEAQTFRFLKKPYDEDFHNVIKAATLNCLEYMPAPKQVALVTHCMSIIIALDLISLSVISRFTVHANKLWKRPGNLIFWADRWKMPTLDENEYDGPLFQEQQQLRVISKIDYEMYIEEYKLHTENDLFPEYACIPFEKTPEYYQRGIILKK